MRNAVSLHRLAAASVLLLPCAAARTVQQEPARGAARVAPAVAQEPERTSTAPREDQHAEMIALIRQIERNLGRIDVDLGDAVAGEAPLKSVDDGGIQELLRATRDEMQSVVEDIDRIFEIRQHHKSSGGT